MINDIIIIVVVEKGVNFEKFPNRNRGWKILETLTFTQKKMEGGWRKEFSPRTTSYLVFKELHNAFPHLN